MTFFVCDHISHSQLVYVIGREMCMIWYTRFLQQTTGSTLSKLLSKFDQDPAPTEYYPDESLRKV